jgi:hypothetical protein
MSNIYLQSLNEGSFRGVPFSIRKESITEKGARFVLHDYPDSTIRHVENLGQIPPKFSVDAFVHGPDWLMDSRNLQAALDNPERGRLVLPVLGAFNVYALQYRINSDQKSLGELSFQLTFAAGESELGQEAGVVSAEEVFDAGDDVRVQLESEIAKQWRPATVSTNADVDQYDIRSLVDKVTSQTKSVITRSDELTSKAEEIKRDVTYLARNGDALAGALFALKEVPASFFQSIANSLTHTLTNIGNIFTLIGFGSELSTSLQYIATDPVTPLIDDLTPTPDIALWPETTGTRILRNLNRRLLVNATRIAALTLAYEQCAAADYLTKQEVRDIRSQLETIYQTIILDACISCDNLQNIETVRRSLDIIRQKALLLLDTKEQQAYNIESRELLEPTSVVALAYRLYAERIQNGRLLDRTVGLVRDLNLSLPALQFSGELEIFSRQNGG